MDKVRYISIDIETTGLIPRNHQILEFAAVAWADDGPIMEQPYFHRVIKPHGDIIGDPFALAMNMELIKKIAEGEGTPVGVAMQEFRGWLYDLGVRTDDPVNVIGQNFGKFDLQFLNKVSWPSCYFSHRIFDLSSITATRNSMPSGSTLGDIPELKGNPHEALFDARRALSHAQDFINWNTFNEIT